MTACAICVHKDCRAINELLLKVGGRRTGAVEAIAAQFGLSRQTVWRHRKFHLGVEVSPVRPLATLEEKARDLSRDAQRLQLLAENGASIELALRALKERRNLLLIEAKLAGKLTESPAVVVQNAVNLPAGPTEEETNRLVREYMEVCGSAALPSGETEE